MSINLPTCEPMIKLIVYIYVCIWYRLVNSHTLLVSFKLGIFQNSPDEVPMECFWKISAPLQP